MSDLGGVGPGDEIAGRYRLSSVIARGGVSTVYRAVDSLSGPVAVKVLRPEMFEDGALVERFRREAEAAANLRSPHTAQVLDFGHVPGGPAFMVMELLEGRSLDLELLDKGALSPLLALDVTRAMLASLGEAHSLDIIHRDLKPSNVFLCASGDRRVKVLDFGFLLDLSARASLRLTLDGMILGTPKYMAPEQITDEPLTAATDIYALGLILYEMLMGSSPFESMADTEVFIAKDDGVVVGRCLALDPKLAALGEIVMKATSRNPRDRYRACEEMLEALEGATPSLSSVPLGDRSWATPSDALLEVDWHLELADEAERREQLAPAARAYSEALRLLQNLLRSDPVREDLQVRLVSTTLRVANGEDGEFGEKMLTAAIKLLPRVGRLWVARGLLFLGNGDLDRAATDLAAALDVEPGDAAIRIEALLGLATIARLQGDFHDALYFATTALDALSDDIAASLVCRTRVEMTLCLVALGRVPECLEVAASAMNMAEEIGDAELRVSALVAASECHMAARSPVEAEVVLKLALDVARASAGGDRVGELLLRLSETVEAQGRSDTAEIHLSQASESYLRTGDAGALAELLRAKFRRRRDSRDLGAARNAALQAADGFASVGRVVEEAQVLLDLGRAEVDHGELAQAEATLLRSLDAQERANIIDHRASTCLLLAQVAGEQGRIGLATSYLKTALAWARRRGSLAKQNGDRIRIAIAHLYLDQMLSAEEVLAPALSTSSDARGFRIWLDYATSGIDDSQLRTAAAKLGTESLDGEVHQMLEALCARKPPGFRAPEKLIRAMALLWHRGTGL